KTVERVGETDPKKPPAPRPAMPETVDLATAARQAKNPVLRRFFDAVALPHDVVRLRSGTAYRVMPLEEHLGTPPTFTGRKRFRVYLDHEWTIDKNWDATAADVSSITYYEQVVPARVDEFLSPQTKTDLPRMDMLRAAEAALTAAVRFHESARERD